MEQENSKKSDVSYGVDNESESAEVVKKIKQKGKSPKTKSKSTKSKVVKAKEKDTEKKPSLINEIKKMRENNQTGTPEFSEKMSELEAVLGVDQLNPFGTNELDIFERNLKGMSYADMRQLAQKVGVSPFQTQARLKIVLTQQFKDQNKNSMRNIMPESSSVIKLDPNNPKHAETLKILGEI